MVLKIKFTYRDRSIIDLDAADLKSDKQSVIWAKSVFQRLKAHKALELKETKQLSSIAYAQVFEAHFLKRMVEAEINTLGMSEQELKEFREFLRAFDQEISSKYKIEQAGEQMHQWLKIA